MYAHMYLICEFVEFFWVQPVLIIPWDEFCATENQEREFEMNDSMSMVIIEGPMLQQITGEHSQALVIVFRNVGRKWKF